MAEPSPARGGSLGELAAGPAAGRLRPIITTLLNGLTTGTIRKARELMEAGQTIGKIVLSV